jgi:hypothetical protein
MERPGDQGTLWTSAPITVPSQQVPTAPGYLTDFEYPGSKPGAWLAHPDRLSPRGFAHIRHSDTGSPIRPGCRTGEPLRSRHFASTMEGGEVSEIPGTTTAQWDDRHRKLGVQQAAGRSGTQGGRQFQATAVLTTHVATSGEHRDIAGSPVSASVVASPLARRRFPYRQAGTNFDHPAATPGSPPGLRCLARGRRLHLARTLEAAGLMPIFEPAVESLDRSPLPESSQRHVGRVLRQTRFHVGAFRAQTVPLEAVRDSRLSEHVNDVWLRQTPVLVPIPAD